MNRSKQASMGKKIIVVLVVGLALTVPLAHAQQPKQIPRIGYVSGTGDANNQGPYVEALRQGLRQFGYVEGKNYLIEYRGAEGNLKRVPTLVNEFVELKVDVIIAPFPPAIRAAKQATKTIPIVMVASIDPVATGLVESLAHPGGNITGISTLSQDLSGKRLELLKEVVPRLSRVGVLLDIESHSSIMNLKEYETASGPLKIQIQSLEVRGINPDLKNAFQTGTKARIGAMVTITNANLFLQQKQIADLAIKKGCLQSTTGVHGSTLVV